MLWPKSGKPIPKPSLILGNENGMDFECSIGSQLLAFSCAKTKPKPKALVCLGEFWIQNPNYDGQSNTCSIEVWAWVSSSHTFSRTNKNFGLRVHFRIGTLTTHK